jgi:hypothetical protein
MEPSLIVEAHYRTSNLKLFSLGWNECRRVDIEIYDLPLVSVFDKSKLNRGFSFLKLGLRSVSS